MYLDGTGKVTQEEDLPGTDHKILLGNRRLSILDLSTAGNQPMGSDGEGWIVYNGELYNYRELRDRLRNEGYTFHSDSDTEVILRSYQEFGRECVNDFRGMFAFGIYDPSEEMFFAARDKFGIKPFYYQLTEDRLAFASEVTALLESRVADPELDLISVDGFLTLGYVPEPRTIIKGIRALPPGSTMRYDVEGRSCEIDSYWSPQFNESTAPNPEEIRKLLTESVRLRLRSDVPVGAFLSGGLDSSTIVALMRDIATQDNNELHTFSISFDQEAYSEADYAKQVADKFETEHIAQTVTADDIRSELDDIIAAMDQPTIDGVNTYFVSQVAADSGLKVVLSGLGSDELLFGYPSFKTVPRRYQVLKRLQWLPSRLRRVSASAIDRLDAIFEDKPTGKLADGLRSETPFGAAYITERGIFTSKQRQALLNKEPIDWESQIEREIDRVLNETGPKNAVSQTELSWYMRNQLLRDTDVMSMTHSLEVRVPFLDGKFAECVTDSKTKMKQGGEKKLLKEAMKGMIPIGIIEREKSGFTFPFEEWLENDLSDIVGEALDEKRLDQTPLSIEVCRKVEDRFYRGEVHWSRLWAIIVLSLWIEEHL